MSICEQCGGRFDRPGLFGCDESHHSKPTLAERIGLAIERDLNDRRDMKWDSIDDETQVEIRDKWKTIIEAELMK